MSISSPPLGLIPKILGNRYLPLMLAGVYLIYLMLARVYLI